MTLIKDVSQLTTAATLEGIFGAAYFGVGRGLGGFIGGFCTDYIGFTLTFQVFSLVSLGTFLMYSFVTLANAKMRCRKYTLRSQTNCTIDHSSKIPKV